MSDTLTPCSGTSTPAPQAGAARAANTGIRIAFVDDHTRLTNSMRDFLEARGDMQLVAACYNATTLLQKVAETRPEIVILDLELPDMSGIELARRLSQEYPEIKVIAYTAHTERRYVVPGIRAGICGWVDKTQPDEDLRTAIYDVATRGIAFTPEVIGIVRQVLPSDVGKEVMSGEKGKGLTERETEVMDLVCQNLSNKQIAYQLGIKLSVVKTHLNNIYLKLDTHDRYEATLKYQFQTRHGQ
jgi:DNA-binding NarL/FixJ family response regulator